MRAPTRLQRRDRRLLEVLRMAGVAIDEVACALGWKLVAVRQRLCVLRASGLGHAVTLWRPERVGRPVCLLSQVSLCPLDTSGMRDFEAWCFTDDRITRADLVTGRCDYVLWSWHADLRAAEAWGRAVELRQEVRACVSQPVRVRFGHTLAGAPIFTEGQRTGDPTA